MTQVRDLSGIHFGQRITITTDHTGATGVLQGFRHDATTLNDGNLMRDEWVTGRRTTTITLLPNQEIIAEMGDPVPVLDKCIGTIESGHVYSPATNTK